MTNVGNVCDGTVGILMKTNRFDTDLHHGYEYISCIRFFLYINNQESV